MENKPWYLSKTFIGLAVIIAGQILGHWHITIGNPDQVGQTLADELPAIVSGLGIALAGIGRIKASTKLTW